MSVKFSNNGHSTLASSLTTSATSITLASGHGARFPSLTGSEYFYATLIDSSNNLEIVKVTARSSDVLTVTRAQESTTARAYAVGDRVELRVTAQGLVDLASLDAVVADDSITAAKINVSGNGTSGQALLSDGDGSFSYGDAGGGLQSQQVFTSTGTWTKPSGIKKIKVIVTGGGGGGGGGTGSYNQGGGGGAGGTAIEIIDVSSVSTVSVTIGAGGSGSTGQGAGGGTSSFGSYCSAAGGTGGFQGQGGGRCAGGAATGGDINITGGDGNSASGGNTADEPVSGHGGGSYWGGGTGGSPAGGQTGNQDAGFNANNTWGVGGGGGDNSSSGADNGGNGCGGIVVVEEYK